LRRELGELKLVVDYGKDPGKGQWGCPVRAACHLGEHQKLTLGSAVKLCFMAAGREIPITRYCEDLECFRGATNFVAAATNPAINYRIQSA
jgi:hypothetical protein